MYKECEVNSSIEVTGFKSSSIARCAQHPARLQIVACVC